MDMDWMFAGDEYICSFRAAGVLVMDGKLLVQREKGGCEYALPGGHVKVGESAGDSLIREFREETGAEIECARLLWTEECFWEWNGKKAHNISFYYLVKLRPDSYIPEEFAPQRDNPNVLIGWLPIGGLEDVTIYPGFIRNEIFDLNAPTRHFVTRE